MAMVSRHCFGSKDDMYDAIRNGKVRKYDLILLDEGMFGWVTKDDNVIIIDSSGISTFESDLSEVKIELGNKVDKVAGKGLSTNDYTTADMNKLAGIESGAEVNVQSDWNETDTTSDAYIKNKPTLNTASVRGVDESVSIATSTNLPTTQAVVNYINSISATLEEFKTYIGI